ncbi:amidase [Dongia deserti]|uniref:amidase n=1 Tax=Dongia deserti TaxID=2268030 RepID=UPI000E64950A|nr:amidase [Dongia deserti]
MKIAEYAELDAVGIAALVRTGEISAREVTEAAIAAVEKLDPVLNALVLKDPESAREHAKHTATQGALAGVPFLVKDICVHVREWPTTLSSRFFAEAPAQPDSEIVQRWRAAGIVFLGKTNLPEFAADFVTEPTFRGATLNPWDLSVTVGGSSGGAASAVASGMVPAAHGSDVGGSIRVPAACCGIFGLKPSRGLNPVGPYNGEVGGGLHCEHVLSRSVRDSAAFLDATAGPEPGAPYQVAKSVPSYVKSLSAPSERLHVVCVPRRPDGSPVAPEIEAALKKAAQLVETLGHEVTMGAFPPEVAEGESWMPLWMADIGMAIRGRSAQLGRGPGPDEIERLGRCILERFETMTAADYITAKRRAHAVKLAMARQFGSFDLILTPTTATLPPKLGAIDSNSPSFTFEKWAASAYGFAPFTEVFNVTGQPAASLPLFQSESGLPIGIQLVGRQNEDHRLLCLAAELEETTGWIRRRPPVWAF